MPDVKIACPHCAWEPDGRPYWQCHCGHSWDTFETAARCPNCKFQHETTQCIDGAGGCGQSSPHLDWYGGLDAWLRTEIERIRVEVGQAATVGA